jgi:predicted nucleic acid-binding protein
VTLIVDAGPLYSQADRLDPDHSAVADVIRGTDEALVVSAFAAAEADFLILTRLGIETELAFLEDLASSSFQVEALTQPELTAALDVARRYRDLELGLADASIVVLAERFQTRRLVTFDERAFRTVTPLHGGRFTLLPADRAASR